MQGISKASNHLATFHFPQKKQAEMERRRRWRDSRRQPGSSLGLEGFTVAEEMAIPPTSGAIPKAEFAASRRQRRSPRVIKAPPPPSQPQDHTISAS